MTTQPAEIPISHPIPETNYGSRSGAPILLVIIHTMEGSERGTELHFQEAASHVSAHYGIDKQGVLHRFLADGFCAYHAGSIMVNRCSLGIELEGYCADPTMFTEPMMATLANLLRYLCDRYAIPTDRQHIIGHNEVPDRAHPGKFGGAGHHTDPGPHMPWASLMQRLTRTEV